MTDVVAFGECMVEVGLTGPSQAALGYAGDTFTASVYLRRQGLSAAYASAVGDGDPFSFDFLGRAADETLLARQCDSLQSEPESIFVQHLVVQRRLYDRHLTLRGRVLPMAGPEAESKPLLRHAVDFLAVPR